MGVITEKQGELANAPLVYTLFALVFPKQLSLAAKVNEIQAALKRVYPIYEEKQTQTVSVVQREQGAPSSISTDFEREHLFFNDDRSAGVIVKPDRIVFHTADYKSFPVLRKDLKLVLSKVCDTLEITHYSSVGIRYVDVLNAEQGSIDELLDSRLLAVDMKAAELDFKFSTQTSIYNSLEGTLYFKSSISQERGLCIPNELVGVARLLKLKLKADGPFAILDFDHSYVVPNEAVAKLDVDQLLARVEKMHDFTSNAFICAVTGKAFKYFGSTHRNKINDTCSN